MLSSSETYVDDNCVDIDIQSLLAQTARHVRHSLTIDRVVLDRKGRPVGGSEDQVGRVVGQWRERRPDLDLDGMAVFGRIYRLARIAELRRNAVLESYGLHVSDIDVLAPLWREGGGLRPLELRRSQLVGSGTLTARLDRLERAGLLERRQDPEDRRGRTLHLTEQGEQLLPELVERLLAIENELLAALSPTARRRLAKDLGRVLSAADPT